MEYKFNFDEKEYILNDDNLEDFINDEENEVLNINTDTILELLCKSNEVEFDKAYYSLCCSKCKNVKGEKVFEYLEYHLYIYTKDRKYVISNISEEYEGTTYTRLESLGKVDNSYIVSVIVCCNCGSYVIEIEELEI